MLLRSPSHPSPRLLLTAPDGDLWRGGGWPQRLLLQLPPPLLLLFQGTQLVERSRKVFSLAITRTIWRMMHCLWMSRLTASPVRHSCQPGTAYLMGRAHLWQHVWKHTDQRAVQPLLILVRFPLAGPLSSSHQD